MVYRVSPLYVREFYRPFTRSGHMVRNKLCWDASYTVGLPQQRKLGWTNESSIVLKVPLRYLCPSIIYSETMWPVHAKSLLSVVKPKPEVITPFIEDTDDTVNQSQLKIITWIWRKEREIECERVTIDYGVTSDWMKKWREFFKPIVERSWCKTDYFWHSNENHSKSI